MRILILISSIIVAFLTIVLLVESSKERSVQAPDNIVPAIGDQTKSTLDYMTPETLEGRTFDAPSLSDNNLAEVHILGTSINTVKYLSGDYEYVLNTEGNAIVTSYICNDSIAYPARGEVVSMPAKLAGYDIVGIGDSAFWGKYWITDINLPDSIQFIGDSAFARCQKLTTVSLPKSLLLIGNKAFCDCRELSVIIFPEKLVYIGDSAFAQCAKLVTIKLPPNLQYIGTALFSEMPNLKSIWISPDNENIAVIDGVLFRKLDRTLICYPQNREGTEYTVPQDIQTIGDTAFKDCGSLEKVILPEGLRLIGNEAFMFCRSLRDISIPASVEQIGNEAFFWCKSLVSISLPESLTSLGTQVFFACQQLKSLKIPDGIKEMNLNLIEYCNSLTTLYLSSYMTQISDSIEYDTYLVEYNGPVLSEGFQIIAPRDSYAIEFAKRNGFQYNYIN